MKHLLMALVFNFALFMLLTPGLVLTLPEYGNKQTVAATHAAIFAAAQVMLSALMKKYLS